VRSLLGSGRVEQARSLLRQTSALRAGDGPLAVDDGALAARITATPESIELIDAYLELMQRTLARPVDPAQADAALRTVTREQAARVGSQSLLDALGRALQRFASGLEGPRPDPFAIAQIVAGLGLALLLFVLGTLGRGLRERLRAEVVLRERAGAARPDPAAHLASADRAIGEGRARDAVHALYLYALGALAAREAIRYDPALTDRELLSRAAGIAHADALRDLVALYERAWFGLREPATEEARRARSLAVRVAG
jgi:uncharacterized protein DUF4129